MRFKIERTSLYTNKPPCEEAYTLPDEDEYLPGFSKYYVDINTIEELLAFTDKYGRVVIDSQPSQVMKSQPNPTIEIYDTYRE